MRDFLGRQPAHFAERERDLDIGGQGGVTAGEDQAEAIVGNAFVILRRGGRIEPLDPLGNCFKRGVEVGAAAAAFGRSAIIGQVCRGNDPAQPAILCASATRQKVRISHARLSRGLAVGRLARGFSRFKPRD